MKAWRHYMVICLFFAGCLALAGRVLHLTLLEKEFLQDQGDARSVREEIIPSHRGHLVTVLAKRAVARIA